MQSEGPLGVPANHDGQQQVGRLSLYDPVEALRRRLRELGGAIYGTKQVMWNRLEQLEKKQAAEQLQRELLAQRRED